MAYNNHLYSWIRIQFLCHTRKLWKKRSPATTTTTTMRVKLKIKRGRCPRSAKYEIIKTPHRATECASEKETDREREREMANKR